MKEKRKPLADAGLARQQGAQEKDSESTCCSCHFNNSAPESKVTFSSKAERLKVFACPDNSASTQRQHIFSYLSRNGSITTLQAWQDLVICHPAMRVLELRRHHHYQIETHGVDDIDSTGKSHRVAKYVLRSDGEGENR